MAESQAVVAAIHNHSVVIIPTGKLPPSLNREGRSLDNMPILSPKIRDGMPILPSAPNSEKLVKSRGKYQGKFWLVSHSEKR